MQNQVTVTGKLKNIRVFENSYGVLVTAQLTQKNGTERAKFTMPIGAIDPAVQSTLKGLSQTTAEGDYTPEVTITGAIDTRFDTRPNVQQSERKAPFTRILVESVELV